MFPGEVEASGDLRPRDRRVSAGGLFANHQTHVFANEQRTAGGLFANHQTHVARVGIKMDRAKASRLPEVSPRRRSCEPRTDELIPRIHDDSHSLEPVRRRRASAPHTEDLHPWSMALSTQLDDISTSTSSPEPAHIDTPPRSAHRRVAPETPPFQGMPAVKCLFRFDKPRGLATRRMSTSDARQRSPDTCSCSSCSREEEAAQVNRLLSS